LVNDRDAQIPFYVFIFIYNSLHVSSTLWKWRAKCWLSSFASVKTTMMKEWFYICLIMISILLFLSLNWCSSASAGSVWCARFDVFTVVLLKIQVFWAMLLG